MAPKSESGRVFDIPLYVGRLMHANDACAFLIIKIPPEDFMQLTGDESGVQVDFPLITARQRGLETKIRDVASRANLEVIDNSGSDGSRFLDLNVNGAPAHVAAICSKLLRGVFGISGDVELVFEHEGLAPSNTT